MINLGHKARKCLINLGKMLPFTLCSIILLSYIETLFALVNNDFIELHDVIILNTPISFKIANVFEYDILIVVVGLIVSFAIEACFWNRLAILYLALHLWLKSYLNFELEIETIYAITIVNIIVSFFFVCKGVGILIENKVK